LPASKIGKRQHDLHIGALGIFRQNSADLSDGLRIQLALHIYTRQCAARHADFGRLHAITATIQPLQFTLNGSVGRLRLESALHVPDGVIEFIFFISNNAQANMRNEIIGHSHEQAAENIHHLAVAAGFEIGFA
jgi:hypothetical protein